MSSKTKFALYTLGCRANQYQSFGLKCQISNDKCQIVEFGKPADIYIINTCTVTSDADKKSRNAIRRALKLAKKVIVTGCYARLKGDKLKEMFPEILLTPLIPLSIKDGEGETPTKVGEGMRIRENLMIEDGCENFCSYCIVPYARGKVKSKSFNETIAEAKQLVDAGVREIILTGINLGAYQFDLSSLVHHLSSIENLLRIRLSSIEPQYITDKLIETIKDNPKICKYLHIPLQSGDDKILSIMNRKYTKEDYLNLINKIRKSIPDCGISTDIIVGHPGEGEAEFENTIDLVEKIQFSRLHIFTFSKRDLTEAANFPDQVDAKTKKERYTLLNKLRTKYLREFAEKYLGKEVEILVEQKGEGLTSNYIRIRFDDPIDSSGQLKKILVEPENLVLN
jgi:threonylcarbamoyladenosine tRNA methylthiotransferase MtaB